MLPCFSLFLCPYCDSPMTPCCNRWSCWSCHQPSADWDGWHEREKECLHYWSNEQVRKQNHVVLPYCLLLAMWPEFACSAKQHPKSTIKKKSPHTFAHLVNFSKEMCLPSLIIIKSSYISYRINKPLACSRKEFGITWSGRTTRAKDHRLFLIIITHKSTRSENPITWSEAANHDAFSIFLDFLSALWTFTCAMYSRNFCTGNNWRIALTRAT